jgi:hypothetical protein
MHSFRYENGPVRGRLPPSLLLTLVHFQRHPDAGADLAKLLNTGYLACCPDSGTRPPQERGKSVPLCGHSRDRRGFDLVTHSIVRREMRRVSRRTYEPIHGRENEHLSCTSRRLVFVTPRGAHCDKSKRGELNGIRASRISGSHHGILSAERAPTEGRLQRP